MIQMTTCNKAWWLFVMVMLLGPACGGKPLPVSYYSLAPIDGSARQGGAVATMSDLSIGIGPVRVPEELSRSQILTRAGDNKVTYAENHRWAGDVENNISGTVRDNISLLLGTERVATFPWASVFRPTYRVVLDILAFDGVRGEHALLSVRWAISDGEGKHLLVVKKTRIKQPVGGETYDDLVKAQSEALAGLSREISEELVNMVSSAGSQKASD